MNVTFKDARDMGFDRGYAIGSYLEALEHLDHIPACYWDMCDEDYVTVETWCEVMLQIGLTVESESRDTSPFELTAYELNRSVYPDESWDWFNHGVTKGLEKAIGERYQAKFGSIKQYYDQRKLQAA